MQRNEGMSGSGHRNGTLGGISFGARTALLAVTVCGLAASPAVGQNAPASGRNVSPAVGAVLKAEGFASQAQQYADTDSIRIAWGQDLARAFAQVGSDPAAARELAGLTVSDFLYARYSARSAPQVSQIAAEAQVRMEAIEAAQRAKLIEQNERIIALLERIAQQRRAP